MSLGLTNGYTLSSRPIRSKLQQLTIGCFFKNPRHLWELCVREECAMQQYSVCVCVHVCVCVCVCGIVESTAFEGQ